MNLTEIQKFMKVAQRHSPSIFINPNFELIVEPKNNIYFRLEDVYTELELKCKVLAWLSRPACKGVSEQWQKKIRAVINDYLGTEFTVDDMHEIYTYLGNDCNRNKTLRFIKSGYNMVELYI
ncbi:hypothetical protein D3C87_1043150 [compost metagenome]